MNNTYRKKRIFLNEGHTKYCVVKVYKDKRKMQQAYFDFQPGDDRHFFVAGVHCAYETFKQDKKRKWFCGPETGTVFMCYQECGAGVVSHELLHAVLWAHKHKKNKRQYPIIIRNMDEEEEILYHHTYAVNQFYNWLYEIEKWFKPEPIKVDLFEGCFGNYQGASTYVHCFHTNQPIPAHLEDRIEKLIQEAINK